MAIKFQPIKVEKKILLDKVPIKEGQFILVIDAHELYVDVETNGKVERLLFDGKDLVIDKTLTKAGFAADAKEVGDKIKLVERAWKELGIKNGLGSGAIQQGPFTIYNPNGTETNYLEEHVSKAFGPNSVAFNRANAYQMSSFAAISGEAGLTEEEFNARFWDSENNQAINGGKGKDENGNILDDYGCAYSNSFSFAVNLAEGGRAKGRGAFTAGWQTQALANYSLAIGKGTIATNENEVVIGRWNETNEDQTIVLIVGNGTDENNRKTVLKIRNNGQVISHAIPNITGAYPENENFVRVKDVSGWSLRWISQTNDDGTSQLKLNIRPAALGTAVARKDTTYALTASHMNKVVQAALIDPTGGANPATWGETEQEKARKTIGAIDKEYVDDRCNGANKALSFENYSTMVGSLNILENSACTVGQNIMIVTLNVPDLWISKILSEKVTYEYLDDNAIIELLKSNGHIDIGYYRLSVLETQKVDLDEFAKKEDVPAFVVTELEDGTYSLTIEGV